MKRGLTAQCDVCLAWVPSGALIPAEDTGHSNIYVCLDCAAAAKGIVLHRKLLMCGHFRAVRRGDYAYAPICRRCACERKRGVK
jgi:hypothetical protein